MAGRSQVFHKYGDEKQVVGSAEKVPERTGQIEGLCHVSPHIIVELEWDPHSRRRFGPEHWTQPALLRPKSTDQAGIQPSRLDTPVGGSYTASYKDLLHDRGELWLAVVCGRSAMVRRLSG
jgi:hypothetical protein